ncbi:MAG: hypothetical protein L6Q59_13265 [Ignavibacteriaceae bacterium]|nr:hypothetical protein [Ignavibacteriaceae bacterium]
MKNSLVIIFCEGESEKIFYQKLLAHLENRFGKRQTQIQIYSVRGVSRFSAKALAKFRADIIPSNPGYKFHVFFAYDSDVFEFGKKPPVDWKELDEKFYKFGADSVFHLIAVRTLEDWLIKDKEGICRNLQIKSSRKLKGHTGLEKITNLYRMADKIYQKGYSINKLLDDLDFDAIYHGITQELSQLIEIVFIKN